MNHPTNDGWDNPQDQIREVIWDKGMPQESREIVRPGDPNWNLGKPIGDN